MIKAKANGLTMTKEIGGLETETLDVLLVLTEKAVMIQLHHMQIFGHSDLYFLNGCHCGSLLI